MPKRKPRPKPAPANPPALDYLDEATNCCDRIAALAQLLACCQAERLRARTMAVAGALIGDEIAKLRQAVKLLCDRSGHRAAGGK